MYTRGVLGEQYNQFFKLQFSGISNKTKEEIQKPHPVKCEKREIKPFHRSNVEIGYTKELSKFLLPE